MGLATHMEAVARHLLGEPNKALSKKTELRFGNHGSLSINLEKGTWFDHQNKTGGGTLSLIERQTGRANGEAVKWMRDELGIELPDNTRQPIAEYPYTDETGNLLFEVCRFEPKDFRQRRPDGSGGWIWSLGDVRRVPFHLPRLLEANNRTIYIAEGEKDVIALERLSLVATCNPGGAGKWRPEFGQFFRAADVVILPHNDAAGEAHAAQVASALRPVAEHVKIVRLPNLPPKGDVSNWIAAGGNVEKLSALCEQEDAEPKVHSGDLCLCLSDWLNRDIPPPDRLLGDLLSTTTRMLLVAPSGLGKTNFAMATAFHMAAGIDFLHWKTIRAARVLFIDGEMSRRLFKKRLADAARRLGTNSRQSLRDLP